MMPGELENILVPIFGMLTGIVITGFIVLGPVGRAVGRVILRVFGADRDPALPPAELRDLRELVDDQVGRLETMQRQLAELAERQDFTERLLAQARERKVLPEGRVP
jgi:hypothetical protein